MRRPSVQHHAALSLAILALASCAGLGERRPAAPVGWAAELPALRPAIGACLAAAGPDARAVTRAWPIGERLAGVRLLGADGARRDCVAFSDGHRILLTENVIAASHLPGEREPLFTPADRRPPDDSCQATRRVEGGGWVSYEACAARAATAAPSRAKQPPPGPFDFRG